MAGAFGTYFGVKHASMGKVIGAGLILGLIVGGIGWLCAPASTAEDEE